MREQERERKRNYNWEQLPQILSTDLNYKIILNNTVPSIK